VSATSYLSKRLGEMTEFLCTEGGPEFFEATTGARGCKGESASLPRFGLHNVLLIKPLAE
jgi:hypothetical protein